MAGKSSKTQVVAIRLPNEVAEIIKRRCENHLDGTVSGYLRDRITYDMTRKHSKNRRSE